MTVRDLINILAQSDAGSMDRVILQVADHPADDLREFEVRFRDAIPASEWEPEQVAAIVLFATTEADLDDVPPGK